MFKTICDEFDLDINIFSRDYYKNPLKRGEKVDKNDLLYCFIEKNLQLLDCVKVFNIGYGTLREQLRYYNIKKDPALQQANREKNCLQKHGVINPSCLEEVKQKRKETNLRVYGYENSSQNPEIKAKKQKTMNERFGGNAPACDKRVVEKIKESNKKIYGKEWSWQTEEIKEKRKDTWKTTLGVDNPLKSKEVQEKSKMTKLKKYGRTNVGQFGTDEHNKAIKEKYKVDHISQNEEIKAKVKETNLREKGVSCILSLPENKDKAKAGIMNKYHTSNIFSVPEIAEKAKLGRKKWRESEEYPEIRKQMTINSWKTRKKNGTCNTSKDEMKILELLLSKFENVEHNYKSKEYPFYCDFYITEIDLYIEYQGDWSHGKDGRKILGAYDEKNQEHKNILEKWKNKSIQTGFDKSNRNRYSNAIEVWTIKDPLKRETARKNGLNWLEFFTMEEFMEWFSSLV